MESSITLIKRYYQAFNDNDMETFFSLLTDDVVHNINQGGKEMGKTAFQVFMDKMNRHYKEKVVELVVMVNQEGTRAAAEFVVLGEYLITDEGLPDAKGQNYRLPAGAFFDIRDGKISRVTNYYNLQDWVDQVSN